MLWSLLLFPLPAFPAAGFWFGRPRGRGVWSSTCPCSVASWTFPTFAWYPSSLFSCQCDRGIGWPPSIFGRRILRFLCIRNLVASCTLWLMAALTDSMRCASVCPRPRRSSLGLWLLYPFFIPWVSVCVVTGTTGSSGHRPGRPSSGISGLSCPFVASWGLCSTRSSPTSLRLWWYIFSGWSSTHGLLWLLHRQIASPGCGPPPTNSVLLSASCLLVAVASGVTVLSVTSGSRGPPADEFAPDLPSPLLGSVGSFGSSAVVSGLSSGPSVVALRGSLLSRCLPCRCPQFLPFGPTLQTSAWGLTWVTGLFPACGTSRRLYFLSMPGSCWLCVTVSSTSSPFCQGPRWPCFAAMSPWSPIYSRWGGDRSPALDTVAQGILRWAESFGFDWLCSSFRGSTMFLRTLSPVLTSSLVPHGLSAWTYFDLCGVGDVRPVCHFRPSPLLHLFLALPRPSLGGDGRAPPVLGQSPGVRFSAVVRSSPGVGEA